MNTKDSNTTAPRGGMPPLWLLALTLAMFAAGTDDLVIAGILPAISTDLHVSEATTGQLVTVYSLTYGLGAPLMAILTARFARRRVLLGAATAFTAATVGMALAPNYAVLVTVRIAAALAAATIGPAAAATAAAHAPPERRGRYLSLVTAGITISLIAGVPVGTWLGGLVGWRSTFLFVAALGALATAGMSRLPGDGSGEAVTTRERFAPLRRPTILAVTTALLVSGSGGMMLYVYLAPVFHHLTGGGARALGLLIMIFGTAGVTGVLLGGRGADRIGPGRTLAFALTTASSMVAVLAVLGITLDTAALPFMLLAVIVVVWALGIWALNPPLQAWLLQRARGADSAVLALQTSAMYLGFSVAASLGGLVLATGGATLLPVVSVTLLLLGSGILMTAFTRFGPREDRRAAEAQQPEVTLH